MTNPTETAREIVRALVRGFADAGASVRLYSEGDPLTAETTDASVIAAELGASDFVSLRVFRAGERVGSLLLCEGNGCDVICDGHERLWEQFPAVFAAADQIADAEAAEV